MNIFFNEYVFILKCCIKGSHNFKKILVSSLKSPIETEILPIYMYINK